MNILITGIAGLLASHLGERLIKEGHFIVGVDNLEGGEMNNVPGGTLFIKADCNDIEIMNERMKNIDVVYHCACTAQEGLSVFSPHFITQNTFGITMSVLSAAINARVKRFIYLSSMARYGVQDGIFTEDMTPNPQDPYGIAKYASELVVKNLCEAHGIEYVLVAPHNIIGTRQKYDDPYRNVASIFINMMLQGRSPSIYGDGNQERCFSFVGDVVDPLVKMATADVSGELFNIGPDKWTITINELYKIIAELTEFKGEPNYLPDRPLEVRSATCSADKARRMLGYDPKTDFKDGLKEMVDDIKRKGIRPFDYNLPIEIESDLLPLTWREKRY